jgi:hypothetical protein
MIICIILILILLFCLRFSLHNKNEYFSNGILDNIITRKFKHIFIIWFQGYENMPEICKMCFKSWKDKNPNWNIILIDNSNIGEYIENKNLTEFKKIKPIQCYADAVRLYLIHRYGGLYVDATIYCNIPLDKWLKKCIINDTFIQWDYDSNLSSINFLFSNKLKNKYYKIYINIDKLSNSYHKINKIFRKNLGDLKKNMINVQNKIIGKSSNNTNPKKGVKIISNSFRLMNQKNDKRFEKELLTQPYFKLSYKRFPKGNIKDIFDKKSKFIRLIEKK